MMLRTEIRSIPLTSQWFRRQAETFLADCGLKLDAGLDYLAGVYDDEERLLGCGGLDGHIIKCLAVSEELRGMDVSSSLVSHLYSIARTNGDRYVTLFTKASNAGMFKSMGFHLVGRSPDAVMMQSDGRVLADYLDSLRKLPRGEHNGVIVMNVNPMTLGHQYLISEAARQVDRLTVIPVADNEMTMFSYSERRAVLQQACRMFENVTVAEGSEFAISASTFPSYFFKKRDDATLSHIALDLDIFCNHIAKALDAEVRFAGTEPTDGLTALYNAEMKRLLPQRGIKFVELKRLEIGREPVSASAVRRLMSEGRLVEALRLVADATVPYLLAEAAVRALRDELDLTPKPGLVDRNDSGAHTDMDYRLMSASISALRPRFAGMALATKEFAAPGRVKERAGALKREGIEAETAMLLTTGNINTHKGAIFSMGMMVAAASTLMAQGKKPDTGNLSAEIASMASHFTPAAGTHGAEVARKFRRRGALHMAQSGYARLFDTWLPFLREKRASGADEREARLLTLLKIMSELDDSNVLYRAGEQEADRVRREAGALLSDFSVGALEQLNESYISRNISPGGAADMLALTIFTDSLIPKN